MKKYNYDGTVYDTFDEAQDAVNEDFDTHYENIMLDYFDNNPKICLEMLNELSKTGNPLWEEIVDDAWNTYTEETLEEYEVDDEEVL